MKQLKKLSVYFLLISIVLLFCCLGLISWFLLTASGGKKVLNLAKEKILPQFQCQMYYSEAKIELIKGFHFKDLSLSCPMGLEVLAQDFLVEYSLDKIWSHKTFSIKNIKVLDLNLKYQIKQDNEKLQKESLNSKKVQFDFKQEMNRFRDELENLPFSLVIEEAEFQSVKLDLSQMRGEPKLKESVTAPSPESEPASSSKLDLKQKINLHHLKFSVDLRPKKLTMSLDVKSEAKNHFEYVQLVAEKVQKINFDFNFEMKIKEAQLEVKDHELLRKIEPSFLKVNLSEFHFKQAKEIEVKNIDSQIFLEEKGDKYLSKFSLKLSEIRAPEIYPKTLDIPLEGDFLFDKNFSTKESIQWSLTSTLKDFDFKLPAPLKNLKHFEFNGKGQFHPIEKIVNFDTRIGLKDFKSEIAVIGELKLAGLDKSKKLNMKNGNEQLSLDIKVNTDKFELANIASFYKTQLMAKLNIKGATQDQIGFDLALQQGKVELFSLPPDFVFLKKLINKIEFNLKGVFDKGDFFKTESLKLNINNGLYKLEAAVKAQISRKTARIESLSELKFPDYFPSILENKFIGELKIPLKISLNKGKDLFLSSEFQFKDFTWRKKDIAVNKINGIIYIDENLLFESGKIKFASLLTQNPFAKNDFDRLFPLLNEASLLNIEALQFQEKVYGPLRGHFSLRQNLILGKKVDLKLGAGILVGEFSLDAYPGNLQIGLLTRITNISLEEVIPQKLMGKNLTEGKKFSGRSALYCHFNKSLLEGRVDIDKIDADQLITLINVLDPLYEDEKLNKARYGLRISNPTYVGLQMSQGYLDMMVDLTGAISYRFDLKGIPISSLVSAGTLEIVKKVDKVIKK